MKLILASASPRRFALLCQAGWEPEVHSLPFTEVKTGEDAAQVLKRMQPSKRGAALSVPDLSPEALFTGKRLTLLDAFQGADLACAYNALGKAGAAAGSTGDTQPVIGADTIVVLGDRILGKPRDREDARQMLRSLAGKMHKVKTAVALLYQGHRAVKVVTTEVRFRSLTDCEIEQYVATGEPLDKAGAYGIQGRGTLLVEGIRGNYDNVVGLPLTVVYTMLREAGAFSL